MITRKIDKHVISQPKEVEFTCYVGKNGKQFLTLWDAILADLGVDLNPQNVPASAEAYVLPGATLTLEAWCANNRTIVEEYKKDVCWVEFKHNEERYCGFRITCETDAQKVALLIVNKYYLEHVIAYNFGSSKAMECEFTDWYFGTCLANIKAGADSAHPYCGYFNYCDRYDHPEMFYGTIMSLYYDVDRDMNILRKEMNAIIHLAQEATPIEEVTKNCIRDERGYTSWTWDPVMTSVSNSELLQFNKLLENTPLRYKYMLDRGVEGSVAYRNGIKGTIIYDPIDCDMIVMYPGETLVVGNSVAKVMMGSLEAGAEMGSIYFTPLPKNEEPKFEIEYSKETTN